MSSEFKPYEIVILGGNWGGIGSAHYLLRHTIPALRKLDLSKTYHVTIITPNTHWLFKPAAPRVMVAPNLLPEEKIWRPLADVLNQYDADKYSIVQGVAAHLDSRSKTVTARLSTSGEQTVSYDSLIIATGTSGHPAWTLLEDQSLTSNAHRDIHAALQKAESVMIAGGGAVGLETAGEIGVAFPSIQLTVVTGSAKPLERANNPKLSSQAESYLVNTIKAKVINNLRVTSTEGDGPTTVTLSDGSVHKVDLYINCTGGRPNSDFLPKEWLDKTGRVIKKDPYFRVRGSTDSAGDAEDVYVVGDVVAGSENSIWELEANVPVVGTAIGNDIATKIGKAGKAPAQREFKPMRNIMVVPIGPNGGVGQVMGWCVPSWFVRITKAKSFLIDLLEPYAYGDKWKKP